jgi:uncharacterized membrane protein YfcA
VIEAPLLLLLPLALLAFFLKGLTGFGAGIVLVPLGALLIGVKEAVLLIGVLDLISNAWLYQPQKKHLRDPFLISMTVFMILGVGIGVFILNFISADELNTLFALILIPLGLWMVLATMFRLRVLQINTAPEQASRFDQSMAFISGWMGGLSGLTGPILAWYLNTRYSKQVFRDIMIPLLLVSACARVILYTAIGAFDAGIIPVVLIAIPGLVIGVWLGNRLFFKVSQKWFNRIVGTIISISGIKLVTR